MHSPQFDSNTLRRNFPGTHWLMLHFIISTISSLTFESACLRHFPSTAGFAGGFGGIVPYGVVGKTLAGGTGVWLAEGPLLIRGVKLVRVDRACVAHISTSIACGGVGEDAGLGKVVCGTRRAPVGVLHLGRLTQDEYFKCYQLLHGCWNSALDMGWAKERQGGRYVMVRRFIVCEKWKHRVRWRSKSEHKTASHSSLCLTMHPARASFSERGLWITVPAHAC